MTRVANGGSGSGSSSYPPTGTLTIENGGNGNASIFQLNTYGDSWEEFGGASDDSGYTLYMASHTSGDYLYARIENQSTGAIETVTLSGFGTFSSQPTFHILGYDIEGGDYWIIFQANGGSGSITVDTLYPMTLSGTTLTLGSGITPPAIAGKAVNLFGGVCNGKICMVYSDTTTYQCDTVRVYDISGASWAAPSGGNSPYSVQPNATLDSNVDNESAFASGARSNKGYWSLNHASNDPCFIKFDYSTETFSDLTSQVPVASNGTSSRIWSMGVEPNGDYAIGYYYQNPGEQRLFLFDIANDQVIMNYAMQNTTFRKIVAGDLSNGNLGRVCYQGTAGMPSLKSLIVDITNSGTFAGAEAVGYHTTSNFDYGAGDVGLAFNIDGGGWITQASVPSIWQAGGYKNIMQQYSTSLKVLMILPYYGGSPIRLLNAGAIHYTT